MKPFSQNTRVLFLAVLVALFCSTNLMASAEKFAFKQFNNTNYWEHFIVPLIDDEIETKIDETEIVNTDDHSDSNLTARESARQMLDFFNVGLNEEIASGSWVIPLDHNVQGTNDNLLKAYGLAVRLLHADIPLKWAISSSKNKDGIDFSANATELGTNNSSLRDFKGSAIIVPAEFVDNAQLILNAAPGNVVVYTLDGNESIEIKYTLTHKPRAAVIENDKSDIHTRIFKDAGLIEGLHYVDDIPAANLSALECVTFACEPHDEGVEESEVANVKAFVQNGGNFFGQCAALQGYEGTNKDNSNKFDVRLLTNEGIEDPGKSGSITFNNSNAGDAIMQFIGPLNNKGGSADAIKEIAGGIQSGSNAKGYAKFNTNNDKYKVYGGRIGGNGANRGYVHYLAGHEYKESNQLDKLNGQRILLNALLMPAIRPESCGLQVVELSCPDPVEELCVDPDFDIQGAFDDWKNSFEYTGGCDVETNISDLNFNDYVPGMDYEKTFTYTVTSTCTPEGINLRPGGGDDDEDCECPNRPDGSSNKIKTLGMTYEGDEDQVWVIVNDGSEIFNGLVTNDVEFIFSGSDGDRFDSNDVEVTIYSVNNGQQGSELNEFTVHVSCSRPLYVGQTEQEGELFDGMRITSGVYGDDSTNLGGCNEDPEPPAPIVTVKECTSTFKVTFKPDAPGTDDDEYCVGDTPVDILSLVTASGDLTWYSDDQGSNASDQTPSIDTSTAGEFKFYVSQDNDNNDCESAISTITITVNALPDAPGTDDDEYCVGDTPVDILSLVTASGDLTWYSDDQGSNASDQTPSIDTSTAGEFKFYVSQDNDNDCESAISTITITVNALPDAPGTDDDEYCVGDTPVDILSLVTASGDLTWYSDDQGSNASDQTPSIDTSTAG
ncbi:Ig-like domain-containing protein, partial [Winogradskyella aurantiaca]|uniref:Ig-like domain-containing protein n=1 Tax=Winogradskyella aurantiaca TaxID=2219558 RepID=UPI0018E59447